MSISDLTLLPPFPPTEEELQQTRPQAQPHLSRQTTVTGNPNEGQVFTRAAFQKSASVGECPDFLDNDIDAIIEQLTVQPPPSDIELAQSSVFENRMGNATIDNGGDSLEFENKALSNTVDLGSLHLDEEYSSLVIPPPPDESFSNRDQEIPIVPPVESVKDRKKLFEKRDAEGYLKNFRSKDSVTALTETKLDNGDRTQSRSIPDTKQTVEEASRNGNDKVEQNDNSPASVSEKLNALLKSLSANEEEDTLGNFRRTSSLRLGRCSSLDFLNPPKAMEPGKNADLVTGSVRVRARVRPKLDMERTFQPSTGQVTVPLKTNSLDRVSNDKQSHTDSNGSGRTVKPGFHRTQSVDVLPTGNSDQGDMDNTDNTVSESFASLKAKLQSYRDSLLNRSMRRKKKLAENDSKTDSDVEVGEGTQRRSSLTRSNSFSSLLRRSLGRSAGRDMKDQLAGRSSSETRSDKMDGAKDDGKDDGKTGSKDRKYWNTLTTPRSTFRPNIGANHTQVCILYFLSFWIYFS